MEKHFLQSSCFHSPFRALSKQTLAKALAHPRSSLVNFYYNLPRSNYGKKTAKGRQKDEHKSTENTANGNTDISPADKAKALHKETIQTPSMRG